MFTSALRQSITKPVLRLSLHPTTRAFSLTNMSLSLPNSSPPKHEMVYFPRMTTSLPSSSGEFRKVLFTGLHSQVVLMTVPVGGDIGDEASHICKDSDGPNL